MKFFAPSQLYSRELSIKLLQVSIAFTLLEIYDKLVLKQHASPRQTQVYRIILDPRESEASDQYPIEYPFRLKISPSLGLIDIN